MTLLPKTCAILSATLLVACASSQPVVPDAATIDAAIARYIPQMFANFPSR